MDYAIFFDQLLRITLQLPNEPAVLIVGVWGPTVSSQNARPALCFTDLMHV